MAVIAYVASRSPEFPSPFPFLAPATQAMAVTLVISGFTRERGGRVNSASHAWILSAALYEFLNKRIFDRELTQLR